MYETLARLLIDEFDVDAETVTPDATTRDLDLDSLALAELAVMVTEKTGVRVDDVELGLDSTLGEIAEQFTAAQAAGTPSRPASA